MKGIIFTAFIEMVEENYGFDVADKIISRSMLPSQGIYTAVGTYPFDEMLRLVVQLSNETKTDIPCLLLSFGEHLFGHFHEVYPHFFKGKNNAFEFLKDIEEYIHVEVLKLYPDAQLPDIYTEISPDGNAMTIKYASTRKMGDLALGLINGCIRHFDETIQVDKTRIVNDGAEITFLLTKS
jgi:hypothetical protein